MSSTVGDWRNGPAYDYFDDLDPEKIALEFLRRNGEYAADYATIMASPSSDDPAPALKRWGLRFRRRSQASRGSGDPCLAGQRQSKTGDTRIAPARTVPSATPRPGRPCCCFFRR